MRSLDATKPSQRILIHITDPYREVQRRDLVVESSVADLGRSGHDLALHNCDRRQVRIGRTQPTAMGNGYREHAGDLARKRDSPTVGRMHRGLGIYPEVDSPMTSKSADGFEGPYHVTRNGRSQTGTQAGWHQDCADNGD